MIAAFALYAMVLSLVIGGLAVLAHRAAALLRLPTRFVWIVAMALMTFAPIALTVMNVQATEPVSVSSAASLVETPMPVETAAPEPGVPVRLDSIPSLTVVETPAPRSVLTWRALLTRAESVSARFDRTLAALWLLGSVMLLAVAWRATRALQRLRSTLKAREIEGATVHVSQLIGPAAVGGVHPVIVVPEWVLELDPSLLTLVLRHEQEHIAKRDPALLTAGLVLLIVVPWLPALWWSWRRLRLAIELDCDARVLRAHPNTRAYAQLLLFVSQHRAPRLRGWPLVSSLTLAINPQVTHLKQRINAMTMRRSKNPLRVLTIVAGMIGTGTMAIVIPAPVLMTPRAPRESSALAAVESTAPAIVAVTYAGVPFSSTTGRAENAPEILLYGSGSVSLGFGNQSRSALRDTLRLTALPAFTADVTHGDLHVMIRRGAPSISLRGYLQSAPTEEFGATGQHLMLPKGGAGMRILGAAAMPSPRQLLEERAVEMQARNRAAELSARNRATDSSRREFELTSVERLYADSAIARRSEMELQRVKLLSQYTPTSQQVRDLERQLDALDRTLRALPPATAARARAEILASINRREAGLKLELEQRRVRYDSTAVNLTPIRSELEQLSKRRQELSRIREVPIRRDSSAARNRVLDSIDLARSVPSRWQVVTRGFGEMSGPTYFVLTQRDSAVTGELVNIVGKRRELVGQIASQNVYLRVLWDGLGDRYAQYLAKMVSRDSMSGTAMLDNRVYEFFATRMK